MDWRLLLASLVFVTPVEAASVTESKLAATVYTARISSEEGWEDVLRNPIDSSYVDDYLTVVGLSRRWASLHGGALQFEAEGQTAYHYGGQEYWEFNAVPIVARWRKYPWSHWIETSSAFGIGLSYTTKLPDLEVRLEGSSHQTLVHWFVEVTAGLPDRAWALSLRLHHRSVAYGMMGNNGGMNGVGLGLRWQF